MTAQRRTRASAPLAMFIVALVVAVVLTAVVALLWLLLDRGGRNAGTPLLPADHCVAVAGDYSGGMTPEQAGNAAIIVGESIRRGLPARAATIALVTAWQESGIRNLNYGDRDSLGIFQQRPSQGWGTAEQIMDPWYAAGKFYDALVKVKDWQTGNINDVAQAVQRSGFPDAYAQHEGASRAWASALTGNSPAALRCVVNNGPGAGGAELVALLTTIWGDKLTAAQDGATIRLDAPNAQTAWAAAQLSMAQLAAYGLISVQVGGQLWQHSAAGVTMWEPLAPASPSPAPPDASPSATPDVPPPTALPDTAVLLTLR